MKMIDIIIVEEGKRKEKSKKQKRRIMFFRVWWFDAKMRQNVARTEQQVAGKEKKNASIGTKWICILYVYAYTLHSHVFTFAT